jgi:segregation and condensation protein B
MNPLPLEALIESVLFVAPEPLEVVALAGLLGEPRDEVERALARLAEAGASRGVRVQRQGDVVQLVTAPEAAAVVSRFLSDERQSRLSSAALETLAVVAYRQPVTRAQVEALRGVNSERALSTLQARGLVIEIGRQTSVGRPVLYGTTAGFLEHFGLTSLAELPPADPAEATAPKAAKLPRVRRAARRPSAS